MSKTIKIEITKAKVFTIFGILLLIIGFVYFSKPASSEIQEIYSELSPQAQSLYYQQSEKLTKSVDPRLVELDKLTIGCFGAQQVVKMSESEHNLGGQCCGALKKVESYNLQLEALSNFIKDNGNIELIPKDPYDVPVSHAKKLIQLDKDIVLSADQQQIYDEAMQMSHHGGPCCCKCWKWYVMSGLGKKLIVDYGWNAAKLAELWDTSSSCGHDEDTDMYKHYKRELQNGREHDDQAIQKLKAAVTLKTNPEIIEAGKEAEFIFYLKDGSGSPIKDLKVNHARLLHVIFISNDLDIIGHVHPEDFGSTSNNGEYKVKFTFPKSGKYGVYLDFADSRSEYSESLLVNVEGSPSQGQAEYDFGKEKSFISYREESADKYTKAVLASDSEKISPDSYKVTIDYLPVEAGKETDIDYHFEKDSNPVSDFEKYLDMPIHFAVVKEDLTDFSHTHGLDINNMMEDHKMHVMPSSSLGPDFRLTIEFPEAGIYRIFSQSKHQSNIIFTSFMVEAK